MLWFFSPDHVEDVGLVFFIAPECVCIKGLSDPTRACGGLTNLFSVPLSSVLDGEFVEFQLFCQ